MSALTDEQREFWDEIGFGPVRVHPGQTPEQARNSAVSGIWAAYAFEGIELPSHEAILAEFDRRASNAER